MINALNLKLQVIITSFRLLKKPTQMYFLECKMLLIKYFSNTKAVGLETRESFSEGHLHKDAHCRQWALNRSPSGEEQPWNVRAVSSPLQMTAATCTSSWLDSGTCTYMHHKEVCVHSLGFFWSPRNADPPVTSSSILPPLGRASLEEC